MKITQGKQKIHLLGSGYRNHRTQESSPTDHFETKYKHHGNKLEIIPPPINKKSVYNQFNVTNRPIRSLRQSKDSYKGEMPIKHPIFDINALKNSIARIRQTEVIDLRRSQPNKKKVPISTRMRTEGKVITQQSSGSHENKKLPTSIQKEKIQKKHTFRSNIKGKNMQKTEILNHKKISEYKMNEKIIFFNKSQKLETEKKSARDDKPMTMRSMEKYDTKLTTYEKEQIKKFEVYFIGPRRIYSKSDFTDSEGDPKIMKNDSIAYRYEIVGQLGHGSFGKVFKAFDHKKKEHVALKIIKSQKKFLDQAKIEVQILQTALFKDPKLKSNIVRMKGSFVFRNHSCITFQILHKNLYEFLKEHKFAGFSLDLIRRFSIQILQALLFFSQNKIIHCDLKPENILLKEQNKSGIKVIDVGSGCFEPHQLYTYIQSRFYRAPEIIFGIRYTPAIDMWSFGCILVELFTGFPVFPGESQNQQMLMFMEVLGLPPREMLVKAQRRKKFFDDNFHLKIPQQKGKQRDMGSIPLKQIVGCRDEDFLNLISRCLQWNPLRRITPGEALLHEWIIKGLPEQIKQQHIAQISQQIYF